MAQSLALSTLVVRDYDEAIGFYVGKIGFFLHADDFDGDHARMSAAGVKFLKAPRGEVYATVAVFEDL